VGKGELTRQTILARATEMATRIGLEGLTIGALAEDLKLSKSGLFAHFRSKEALEVQVLEFAAAQFVDAVVRPALVSPRGEPRLRRVFEAWLTWARTTPGRGGCLFVAAATELDDRPGSARDRLVRAQRDWLDFIAGAVRIAIEERHFRPETDPQQFAHDLYGVMLAYHHASRLMKDPRAAERARRAFEALVDANRAAARPARGRLVNAK
jgi:AcrR family transcriptional regulator